jgi:hypothetical protein
MSRRQGQTEKDAGTRWSRQDRTAQDQEADERDEDGEMEADASDWSEELEDAPMEELQALAEELDIEGFETRGREELVRRIRKERGAEL